MASGKRREPYPMPEGRSPSQWDRWARLERARLEPDFPFPHPEPGADTEGLTPDEAARMRAMWAQHIENKKPTARTDVTDKPVPLYSGTGGDPKGTIQRGKAAPQTTGATYPPFERIHRDTGEGIKTNPFIQEADPVVGQRRVSLDGIDLDKVYALQKQLENKAKVISRTMDSLPPDSPRVTALERELAALEGDSAAMGRLAHAVGTIQQKTWRKGAPESHGVLGDKVASWPEIEAAARTIEKYRTTGKVASLEQIAQMKIDIEKGLTAGTDQNRALVEVLGEKKVASVTKKRDALLKKTSEAEAAVAKETGQSVTSEMVRNPRGHDLGPHALRALNNARKAALAFDAEIAKLAISNFKGLVAGARTIQGPKGRLRSIEARTPETGEKIERADQLFRKPGAKSTARGTGRGRGRGLNAMQRRVRNYYKNKIHKDAQASRKKEGFIGWDTFIVYANPSMAQYQTLHDAIIGTDGKKPTSKQKKAAEEVKSVLRAKYDKEVGAAKTGQTDFRTREQIKTENKLRIANDKFTKQIKRDIKRAETAQDKQKLQHVLHERLLKIKHNIRVLPYYTDQYLQTKFGEIKKVRKGKGGTPVDVPEIPAGEPTGEGPAPKADAGPAPKADPKLADAVSAVEQAILPKDKEALSDYRNRVGPLYAKVAAMKTDAARTAARRLKILMNKNMPNE